MHWRDPRLLSDHAEDSLDRLGMAAPLLGATGWIDSLARLVAVDSTASPELVALLQDMFAPLGFGLRKVVTGPEPEAIALIATRPTGRPVCSIHFHLNAIGQEPARAEPANANPASAGSTTADPATPASGDAEAAQEDGGWTRPRRSLTRQGHRLYGEGTSGVKGAIAAVWAALRASDAVGLGLGYDPLLVFSGSDASLGRLAARGEIAGHVLALNGAAAPRLWAGSLGSLDVEVRLQGAGAQDMLARPVMEQLSVLQALLAQRPGLLSVAGLNDPPGLHPHVTMTGPGITGPGITGPGMTGLEMAGAERSGPGQAGLQTEVAGMTARGDEPGEGLRFRVHRRYAAAETFDAVLRELETAVGAACVATPGLQAETRLAGHLPPVSDPDTGPNSARWQAALSWGFGFPPEGFQRWGSAKASALGLVQQAGIREILMGGLIRPGQRGPGPDECTTVEDVEALARSVLAYLADIPVIPDY